MPGGLVPLITNSGPSKSLYAPASGGGSGGGGGPNPSVSTLSVNDGGSINMSWNNGGPILSFPYEATNTSSFGLVMGVQPALPTIAPAQGCMAVVETNGNPQTLSAYAPLLTGGIEIRQQNYPGVQTAALYTSTGNTYLTSAAPIALDAPGVLTSTLLVSQGISTAQVAGLGTKFSLRADDTTYISISPVGQTVEIVAAQINAEGADLTVSSINGQAPGGGAINNFSTASVSSLTVSTIGGWPAPTIVNADSGGWISYGAISGAWGTFNGTIAINATNGNFTSTFQLPPVVHFDGAPYMNAYVTSRAVGVGALRDIATFPQNESSITVTAAVIGNVDNIGLTVFGPAIQGFYPNAP